MSFFSFVESFVGVDSLVDVDSLAFTGASSIASGKRAGLGRDGRGHKRQGTMGLFEALLHSTIPKDVVEETREVRSHGFGKSMLGAFRKADRDSAYYLRSPSLAGSPPDSHPASPTRAGDGAGTAAGIIK